MLLVAEYRGETRRWRKCGHAFDRANDQTFTGRLSRG